jgi:hypothetical protein
VKALRRRGQVVPPGRVAGPCITRIQVRTSHVSVSHGALVGISAALAQDLVNFCFIGPTSDFIGTGLSIFMVSYPTTEAIAALRDLVALYDQQVDNDQSVTVKDADRIREEQKFCYPTTYAGTKEVLRAYHWLLYVVLGEQHPITVAFGLFVRRFEEKEPVYSKSINDPSSCAGLLKFVKTTVHHAIDAHFRNQSQPTLDFLSVYTKIDYKDWSPQLVLHPAIPILQQLRDEGAYVQRSARDWSLEQRDAAVRRGAHQSTRAKIAMASYISSIKLQLSGIPKSKQQLKLLPPVLNFLLPAHVLTRLSISQY